MKKIEMLKTVSGIIVSVGVSAIVGNAVNFTTPSSIGRIAKICTGAGKVVLASMVSKEASKYTEHKIDEAAAQFKDAMSD